MTLSLLWKYFREIGMVILSLYTIISKGAVIRDSDNNIDKNNNIIINFKYFHSE